MEYPEKLSTFMHCKQDEGKQNKTTTQYVLDTTMANKHKQRK